MRKRGLDPDQVRKHLHEARERDLSYENGDIMSSMCTTPHPLAEEAHRLFLETYLGDPGLFPGTSQLEDKAVEKLANLLNLEGGDGYITTGGTESNIQALHIARNLSNSDEPSAVVPESAHFSFDKAADMLQIDLKKAELDDDYRADPSAIENLVDGDTAAIVGVAGTTETGQIDPIRELGEIAEENDAYLHVDAAFGGFVLPFLTGAPRFDFSIDAVDSVTLDPHKMGLSTIPSGGLIVRDPDALNAIRTDTPYLTSEDQYTLTGTRTGAGAASTYAALETLGRNGYRENAEICMERTKQLARRVENSRNLELTVEPVTNLVSIGLDDPGKAAEKLDEKGGKVSVSRLPEALRVVLMPHVHQETVERFVEELEEVA